MSTIKFGVSWHIANGTSKYDELKTLLEIFSINEKNGQEIFYFILSISCWNTPGVYELWRNLNILAIIGLLL